MEWLLFVTTLVVVGLYRLFEISLHGPVAMYLQRFGHLAMYYFFGLAIAFLVLRLRSLRLSLRWRETGRLFLQSYITPRSLFTDLRQLNIVTILFVLFIHLKHLIWFVNPSARNAQTTYDRQLFELETSIFHGVSPTTWLQDLFGRGDGVTFVLSAGYAAFYGYLAFLVLFFVLQRDRERAKQFFLALAVLWIAGVMVVFAAPTWGPCFFSPETVASLPRTTVALLQEQLWQNMQAILNDPAHSHGLYLISAFPSLHLAATVLGTLALRRTNPVLSALSGIFVLVTAITTIYFGWHYVLDDIAAIILAWGVWSWCRTYNKHETGTAPSR